jgi:hypothetical protein
VLTSPASIPKAQPSLIVAPPLVASITDATVVVSPSPAALFLVSVQKRKE